MEPEIVRLNDKLLIGISRRMSLAADDTYALWHSFMPHSKTIPNRSGNELISLQQYDEGYFAHFDPKRLFDKWAAVEVTKLGELPEGMQSLELEGGSYAAFFYRGPNTDTSIFRYIYTEWLPRSAFQLDNRPHFQIMGEKYKNGSPDSEETIYIPVSKK